MKISLLIESEKPASEASKEIQKLLSDAGYTVKFTWPNLEPAIKRITRLKNEIKKIK